jgi:hypothetical protein
MPTDDPPTSSPSRYAAAPRGWLVPLLAVVASMMVIGILVTRRDSGSEPPASATSAPSIETTTTTGLSVQAKWHQGFAKSCRLVIGHFLREMHLY